MIKQFQSNIHNNALFSKDDRLLLAFSGGVDSVVLAQLLHASGYPFDMAHCHFNLRGKESDGDEVFCRQVAEQLQAGFHSVRFDTTAYAGQHKLSIQMAARELRYNWFSGLKQEHGYDYILTAHHADDHIETFFVNLVRGTGLHGLQGIRQKQNNIVRPLLFAFKDDILRYAKEHSLAYREDSSNAEVKYKRNFIRHTIIPELKTLNPAFGHTMLKNMEYLGESEEIVQAFVQAKYKALCDEQGDKLSIDLQKLEAEPYRKTLLHHWLYPFGFNSSQLQQLAEGIERKAGTGKIFMSDTYQLTIDRQQLVVSKKEDKQEATQFTITAIDDTGHLPISLHMELNNQATISQARHIALLDADLIAFPLTLRRWREGDKFKPLGMTGFKKLSDYFTSEKLNLSEKEAVWLLESNNNITWLVNRRIDERFKITTNTKNILKITYI